MRKLLAAVAFAAATTVTPALAQDHGGHRGGMKDQSRAQAQQRADMLFQMLDSNRDGSVTKPEAQQALAKFEAASGNDRRSGRMQRMIDDAFSATAAISLQQFEAQALARFDAQDLDHDGKITAAERQQRRAAQSKKAAQ